ncbi:hypothetical protein GCM10010462_10650 [Microbacterium dextranolyticum]|uniref:Uncharacterized protein n=1 Tax=Microbacterium dextranolyticum TaxID=36806 RepID=A0A9W6HKI5_9MICO|nr:hypothetical protein GCM10017591_02590 [Microbacterium dextranolyticum]
MDMSTILRGQCRNRVVACTPWPGKGDAGHAGTDRRYAHVIDSDTGENALTVAPATRSLSATGRWIQSSGSAYLVYPSIRHRDCGNPGEQIS